MATCAPSKIVTMPRPSESSTLRSPRDRDDVRQGWKYSLKQREQVGADRVAVEQLARQVEKMRRRILGGSGTSEATTTSGGMTYRGEWSGGLSYTAQDVVTRGAFGEFICIQDVAGADIGFEPERGAPFWHSWVNPPPGVWA